MAKETCGDFMFGTTAVTNISMAVESTSAESKPQFTAQAKNKDGETVAVKVGKLSGTATVSGFKKSDSAEPKIGDDFMLEGKKFFVDKVSVTQSNEDFQKMEVTGKFWDGISGACGAA